MKFFYGLLLAGTLLLLFACNQPFPAPSEPNKAVYTLESARFFKDKLDHYRQARQQDSVLITAVQALPAFKAIDSLAWFLNAGRSIGYIKSNYLNKRVEALQNLWQVRSDIWRAPSTKAEKRELMLISMVEARINLELANLREMKAALERTEVLMKDPDLYGTDHGIAWYFYPEMANVLVRLGEFEVADQYFRESISYEKEFDETGIASYNDYGSIFLSQGNYPKALEVFEAGLGTGFVDTFTQTLLLLNKSEAQAHLQQLEAANTTNEQAGKYLRFPAHFGSRINFERCKRGYLENKAILAEQKKDWPAAIRFYHQATDSALTHELTRRELAAFQTAEANAWLQQGDYPTALAVFQKAWQQYYPSSAANPEEIPDAASLLTDKIIIEILEGKARTCAGLGHYETALGFYEKIPVVEAQIRATHTFESSSLLALRRSRHRFDDAVELAWTAWNSTHNPLFAEKAFLFTEKARGVLQARDMASNEAADFLPENEQAQERQFLRDLAEAETELAAADGNDSLTDVIMLRIRSLKKSQQGFRETATKKFPNYATAISEQEYTPMKTVAELLRPGQLLLDYYLVDSTALHVFAFDHTGNVSWRRVSGTQPMQQNTEKLITYLSQQDLTGAGKSKFIAAAAQIFETLVQPELTRPGNPVYAEKSAPIPGNALLVIPDLQLAALPFEVLLTAEADTNATWSALPYLMRQQATSYAFSISLLHAQQRLTQQRTREKRIPFAGFAPEYANAGLRLDNAGADVDYGYNLFGGQKFSGPGASEKTYREMAGKAQVLLLCMHGVSDWKTPARPRST